MNAGAVLIPNSCKRLCFISLVHPGRLDRRHHPAKSVLHVHMTLFWTIVVGIIGGIFGGAVTHLFAPPTNERFHPVGLILSTLGAILILTFALNFVFHFPRVG